MFQLKYDGIYLKEEKFVHVNIQKTFLKYFG